MLVDQTTTKTITLTPAAVQAIHELMEKRDLEDYALRIYVSGSGCSGLQYGMTLDNNIREEDVTYEYDGVKAIIDEISIQYLLGSTVDYVDDLMGSGFKIDNPNAVAGCGCSSSTRTEQGTAGESSPSGCGSC